MAQFDASATINDLGRYINHQSSNQNLTLMKSIFINGSLQIGLVAKKDIKYGEKLFFIYGIRNKEIPWLITKSKKWQENSKKMESENTAYTTGVTANYSN